MLVTGHGSLNKINPGSIFKTSMRKSEIMLKQQLEGTLRQESSMGDSMEKEGILALKQLRENKDVIERSLLQSEEDDDLARFEYLYGARLAKTHKKFNQHKQQHKIDADFEVEKNTTQDQVIQRIIGNHDSMIASEKNRK